MPDITDIPLELFLDNILPLLPIPDLLSLSGASRDFYKLASDDTFWHQKIQADFNFSGSETARTTGWKFIYKRLRNPKIYVWGYVDVVGRPRIVVINSLRPGRRLIAD